MADQQPTSDQYADERWLPIPGWEPLYQVSDKGRVRSLYRTIVCKNGVRKPKPGRILKASPSDGGHLFVKLYDGGRYRGAPVHLLMMEAFVGPCPEGMEVLHHNDVPDDNRLDNLRYGTRSANVLDMVRNGNHNHARVTSCKMSHPYAEPNLVPSSLKKGGRSCLACSRARAYARNHPEWEPRLQELSDYYFAKIMRDAPAA